MMFAVPGEAKLKAAGPERLAGKSLGHIRLDSAV